MLLRHLRARLLACAILAGAGASCVVEAVPPPPSPRLPPPFVIRAYSPLYYRGYVVYYDRLGQPFYYVRGVRRYIPRSHVHYERYARHYRMQPRNYERWYQHDGRRYRDYRRSENRPPHRAD